MDGVISCFDLLGQEHVLVLRDDELLLELVIPLLQLLVHLLKLLLLQQQGAHASLRVVLSEHFLDLPAMLLLFLENQSAHRELLLTS